MLRGFERFGSTAIPMHMAIFNVPLTVAARFDVPLVVWGENSAVEYVGDGHRPHLPARLRVGAPLRRGPRHDRGGLGRRTSSRARTSRPTSARATRSCARRGSRRCSSASSSNGTRRRRPGSPPSTASARATRGPRTGLYDYADIDDDFISIHHWMKWLKFGFTRTWDNLSLEIRNGRMTRDEAIDVLRERGDETPARATSRRSASSSGSPQERFDEIAETLPQPRRLDAARRHWVIDGFLIPDWDWQPDVRHRRARRAGAAPAGAHRAHAGADAPPRARRPRRTARSRRRRAATSTCCTRGSASSTSTTRSNQPFKSGSTWLAFNGELYNYVEVRATRAAAASFRTDVATPRCCATALDRQRLGRARRLRGHVGVRQLRRARRRAGLSRDRFGEKPLYLYRDGDDLYFGSEVKFIVALLGRPLPVNHRHLRRYLVNGYKSLYKTRETFFEGLERAAARQLARARSAAATSARAATGRRAAPRGRRHDLRGGRRGHARAPDPLGRAAPARRRAARLLHERRRRLDVADLDRQERLRLRRARLHDRQRGRALRGAGHGRAREARRSASATPRSPPTPPASCPKLRELVRHHDAPVYTITYYVHWLLMESIHEHGYRISVSGTAADELFSGYYDHHLAYLHEVRDEPALFERSVAELARAHRADRAQPVPPGPRLLRRGPGAARPHLPRRRASSRRTCTRRSTSRSRRRDYARRCCATACSTSCSTSRCR